MRKLFREIFIVTNQPELYSHLGVPMFGDVHNIRGPMTGVLTALMNSSNKWIFVSACDMPFINPGLIRFMADERHNPVCLPILNARQKKDFTVMPRSDIYDVVVPVLHHRAEPLFAFYSIRVLNSLEQFILSGKKGIKDFLLNHDKRVKYISSEEIKNIDPDLRSFINLNTPEDIEVYLSDRDKLKFQQSLLKRINNER